MSPEATKLYAAIRTLRLCFNRLKGIADDMHHDLGVNASRRAVMEVLAVDGPRPVPEIASSRGVSRQHIQVNVDALARAGHVETRENPAHKRSPLIRLTKQGSATFKKIRQREEATIEQLACSLAPETIETVATALNSLEEQLNILQREGNHND